MKKKIRSTQTKAILEPRVILVNFSSPEAGPVSLGQHFWGPNKWDDAPIGWPIGMETMGTQELIAAL